MKNKGIKQEKNTAWVRKGKGGWRREEGGGRREKTKRKDT
jgi:hypothetical protein